MVRRATVEQLQLMGPVDNTSHGLSTHVPPKDVIALRKSSGTISGKVLINGFPQVGDVWGCG